MPRLKGAAKTGRGIVKGVLEYPRQHHAPFRHNWPAPHPIPLPPHADRFRFSHLPLCRLPSSPGLPRARTFGVTRGEDDAAARRDLGHEHLWEGIGEAQHQGTCVLHMHSRSRPGPFPVHARLDACLVTPATHPTLRACVRANSSPYLRHRTHLQGRRRATLHVVVPPAGAADARYALG